MNKHDEAEQLWQEALTISPQHPESTYNLGLTCWRLGRLSAESLRQQLRDVCVCASGRMAAAATCWRACNWSRAIGARPVETLESVTGAGTELEEVRAVRESAQECLTDSGRLVRRFTGHTGWVSSVCAGRNGRSALSGGADGTLELVERVRAAVVCTPLRDMPSG